MLDILREYTFVLYITLFFYSPSALQNQNFDTLLVLLCFKLSSIFIVVPLYTGAQSHFFRTRHAYSTVRDFDHCCRREQRNVQHCLAFQGFMYNLNVT